MGVKLIIEVEVGYPDLSSQKHIDFLRYVFKDKDIKTVKLLNDGAGREHPVIPNHFELAKQEEGD